MTTQTQGHRQTHRTVTGGCCWSPAADGKAADLEFIATTDETNIEDQLAMLSEAAMSVPAEAEIPLRLLRHYASSIRHQQYHDIDILMIRVESVGGQGQVGWD